MRIFQIVIFIFAGIALITGANDLLQGLEAQRAMGADLKARGFADPLMDNVFRFFAGLWIGTGALFILFVRDLDRYKPAMVLLLMIVVLGGFGRLLSLAEYGMPEHSGGQNLVVAGLIAELVISPILIWWLLFRHGPSQQGAGLILK